MKAVGRTVLIATQENLMKEQPTPQWLADQQAVAGVSDEVLAHALGYVSPSVVQRFKAGDMKVPVDKATALALALGLSPGVVMRRLLHDLDPDLLQAIEHCLGPLTLSDGERRLIAAVRKRNPGREPVPVMFDRDAIITLVVA